MVSSSFFVLCSLLALIPNVIAAPIFGINIFGDDKDEKAGTTAVSQDTIDADLKRPAQMARLAYCSAETVTALSCGAPCDDLGKNLNVFQIGGDNGLVPMYFIAHDADAQQLVVSHQGTNKKNILSILNDAQFVLKDLNTTRFTSAAGKNIQVHDGFQDTFERTADGLLAGVKKGLADFGVKKVLVTGHSLGAAIASMDAMMLKQELDPSVEIQAIGFGLPRVGNQEWADFVDSGLSNTFKFVTNQHDPVPSVPPKLLNFVHPQGEIHINAVNDQGQATDVVACQGQDNESCISGNNLLQASVDNHLGPYFDGIGFGNRFCPT